MKILHVMKTSTGGDWAARQVTELVRNGNEIHVVLPSETGRTMNLWRSSGAKLHFANFDFPVRQIWNLPARLKKVKDLVNDIEPDLIHSHFVGTTLTLRLALGKAHRIPRFFQVPGPLHLENFFFRRMEIALAGTSDYWVASSRYIEKLYQKAGISPSRIFLSYYGLFLPALKLNNSQKSYHLRERLGVDQDCKLITNVSFMYPPKYYLGQWTGLKCHEDLIEALSIVVKSRNVIGVLVGGQWGEKTNYEKKLHKKAARLAGDRIRFLGSLDSSDIASIWQESDLAIHVPRSENCGGIVEPLLAGVPVIASRVGGIPEVIVDNQTGHLVPARNAGALADKIFEVLDHLPEARTQSEEGHKRVYEIFDIQRNVADLTMAYNSVLKKKGQKIAV